ncbi:PREDICTED: POPTR_0002s12330g [Prunus dulcis]|uniref:PREDICTED: POPTR_0002s12330g n=1 Tax=Prunus dulcis TaxID=3755 RepID=A0A5E4EE11_PRUDU|nr:PREDICTED: POPTR_0002s12330g [Prunus dulcis]
MPLSVPNNVEQKQQEHEDDMNKRPQQQQQQRLRHSFETFFSSKRKVPNASDPLHNR